MQGLFHITWNGEKMVVVSHLFPFYGNILPDYSYFNPCLHEGGDTHIEVTGSMHQDFNPRLREGGDV